MKKKLTKSTLDELAKAMPIISEWEMRTMVGGSGVLGSAENPYSVSEFNSMLASGHWTSGGFVKDMGYVSPEVTITGTLLPGGIFDTYYVGPTSDEVLAAKPTPVSAADYIAMLHDLEYKKLGLNGITGVLDPKSRDADNRLIQRCTELIKCYEMGMSMYNGYEITPKAYCDAIMMRKFFNIEQTITGTYQW